MTTLSPQVVYNHLQDIDKVALEQSAAYREEAYEVITDETISRQWQESISDRLNQANHDLAFSNVESEESY